MKIHKNFLLSVGLLAGTIIGAGVFSLPYIFKTAGLSSGFFYLALGTIVYVAIYRMYAQVILQTPGHHRFVGYVKKYLGEGLSLSAILMSVVQVIFVLTIYLILSQSFANLIMNFGYGVEKMIVFWAIGSAIIFLGARRIAWLESLVTVGIIAVIFLVFIFALLSGKPFPVDTILPNWGNFLLPLGPILFSLAGRQAIPDMVKLNGNYKKTIFFGVFLSVAVYLLFIFSVLALSPVITEDAVSGLAGNLPGLLFLGIIGFFGILSLLSSYGTVGRDVYESLEFDLRMPFWLRFLIIVFGPIGFYFAGLQSFIGLVSFVGGIFLALEGIFIVWMWLKATQKRISWPVALLLSVFMVALVYEIIK